MKPRGLVGPVVCLLVDSLLLLAESPVSSTATFAPPDTVHLSWASLPGRSYQIRSTTNLLDAWEVYPTNPMIFVADGEALSAAVQVDDAVRFFQAVELDPEPFPVPGMVWIPPGTFTMGSPSDELDRWSDEGPLTQVTISRGFWLGKCEVTQRGYEALIGGNPSHFKGDLERPVEQVSWNDAVAYGETLTRVERAAGTLPDGYEYRLPTEAQWEYACRAGTTTRFSFDDALGCDHYYCNPCAEVDQYMVWCGNDNSQTERVGTRLPNPWGLYDMHGNVWEWCADWWAGGLPGGSVTDPSGPPTGLGRVVRGGAWSYGLRYCRSATHGYWPPSVARNYLGFRVALVPVP